MILSELWCDLTKQIKLKRKLEAFWWAPYFRKFQKSAHTQNTEVVGLSHFSTGRNDTTASGEIGFLEEFKEFQYLFVLLKRFNLFFGIFKCDF